MTILQIYLIIVYVVQLIMLRNMYKEGITIKNIDVLMACMAPLSLIQIVVVSWASHFIDLEQTFLHKD